LGRYRHARDRLHDTPQRWHASFAGRSPEKPHPTSGRGTAMTVTILSIPAKSSGLVV
jgi:hypothetical protein